MTQINWQYQVNNRAGGYIVTATDWNDFAGNFRAFIDQTTGSGTTDNSALPIGIDLVNDRVYISDPDSTTPENANHADTTLSVVGTTTLNGNTQQTGTLTVGVDDTGYDVKFFGATSGKYMLWDESADKLVVSGTIDSTVNPPPIVETFASQSISASGTTVTFTSSRFASAPNVMVTQANSGGGGSKVPNVDNISASSCRVFLVSTSGAFVAGDASLLATLEV
jgi:hypothetical protein